MNNNKIWKIVGILLVAYIIIWLWPVAFHRPFFNGNDGRSYPPYPAGMTKPSIIVTEPASDSPNPNFGGDGYEDPVGETPYDPSNPDPIAPPHSADEPGDQMVACTMEAKACPDGSYVGRQGPNCEFAPCPGN